MFGQIIVFLLAILPHLSANVQLYQWPRFVGLKAGRSVVLSCRNYAGQPMTGVTWKKRATSHHSATLRLEDSGRAVQLMASSTVSFGQGTGSLALSRLQPENSGIYHCFYNGTEGPGSEVQVHKQRNLESIDAWEIISLSGLEQRNLEAAIRRSNMKDVVIFLQALLLGIFLLIPYLCYKDNKAEKEEALYEEPEQDHTYEGLDIEHCALYEDIPAFSQQEPLETCSIMENPEEE